MAGGDLSPGRVRAMAITTLCIRVLALSVFFPAMECPLKPVPVPISAGDMACSALRLLFEWLGF